MFSGVPESPNKSRPGGWRELGFSETKVRMHHMHGCCESENTTLPHLYRYGYVAAGTEKKLVQLVSRPTSTSAGRRQRQPAGVIKDTRYVLSGPGKCKICSPSVRKLLENTTEDTPTSEEFIASAAGLPIAPPEKPEGAGRGLRAPRGS